MKKVLVILILIILLLIGPYKYNNENAVNYVISHKNSYSRSMCAWYVMKAIRHGGCRYCYIYPGYAYNKVLPKLGFKEISTQNYIPQRGDISVLPKNNRSSFGHIAIYDGTHWISDFEQKDIFPGSSYKLNGKYQIYRIEDGWHWCILYEDPRDIVEYISILISNYDRIKFRVRQLSKS